MEDQPAQPISLEGESATILLNGEEVASGSSGNGADPSDDKPGVSGVHLVLMCVDTERHVTFHEGVIDNEGMNRHKSKCCCIYRKPHVFGESSSSSDDECEHCCGHPEVRLRNRLKKQQQQEQPGRVYHCKCHHHHRPQHPTVAADTPEESPEIAGDSGNVKSNAQLDQPTLSLTLVSTPSSATVQH